MPDEMSLRQWLERYGDWLGFSQLIALMVGSVIGFMQRSRGLAILFSHVAASVTGIVTFTGGISWGYGVVFVAVSSGVVGGGLGMALFRILLSVSDRLDKRRDEIADKLIDKVSLTSGDK